MSERTKWVSSVGVGIVSLGITAPAWTQNQSTPADQGAAPAALDEVVVTATRRAQTLQDVAMTVDVATGEQLQRLNLFDVKDIQQLTPGLQLTNNDGRSNTATIRGIAFNPDQGTSPAVDVYLNEVPVDAQTVFTALYDIDQIEVLRGPQGALRGRTAPGGAITIRTRRPSLDAVNGYLQTTGTDEHGYNAQGAVSIPLITGKLAMRVAALGDGNRLNQVTDVNLNDHSRSRTQSGRLSLAWAPTEDFDTQLTYQYLHADNTQYRQVFGPGNTPAQFSPARSGPALAVDSYDAVSEGIRQYRNNTQLVNLDFDWRLGPVTLAFVGARQHTVLLQQGDLDVANAIPGYTNPQNLRTPYDVTTGELRLLSDNTGIWNWTLGVFYTKQSGDVTSSQKSDQFFGNFPISMGLLLPITASTFIPVDTRQTSFAASSSFKFTDQLTLEVAARYSDIHTQQSGFVTVSSPAFPTSTSALVAPNLAVSNDKPVTGGATLSYKLNGNITTYVAYGRSFRAPTAGVAIPQNISADLVKTTAEHSDAMELGLKSRFLDDRLSLNVDVFYQKFNGYISRFPGISYDNGVRNPLTGAVQGPPNGVVDGGFDFNYNGDAKARGIEATVAGRPTANWDFSASAAYARSRYDNARLPCNDYNGDGLPDANGTPRITGPGNVSYCLNDDRIADVPSFSFSANTEVRFPAGTLTPFVRGLFSYQQSFFSSTVNFDYPSRSLLNLYVGLRGPGERWEVSLFARNALDQKRITNISAGNFQQSTFGAPYDSGYRTVNVTNPREFGLTATYSFD